MNWQRRKQHIRDIERTLSVIDCFVEHESLTPNQLVRVYPRLHGSKKGLRELCKHGIIEVIGRVDVELIRRNEKIYNQPVYQLTSKLSTFLYIAQLTEDLETINQLHESSKIKRRGA